MIGVLILTGIALIIGIIIVIIDATLNKKDDEIVEEIEKLLPGLNCGGCGFGGCKGMAENILKDPDAYKKCRPLRDKSNLIKYLEEHNINYNKD